MNVHAKREARLNRFRSKAEIYTPDVCNHKRCKLCLINFRSIASNKIVKDAVGVCARVCVCR